jgi:hypothetical protein
MNIHIQLLRFMQPLLDDQRTAKHAAEIGQAMLAARSLYCRNVQQQRCQLQTSEALSPTGCPACVAGAVVLGAGGICHW